MLSGGGLPAFEVVGLPDAAAKEARERVRAAMKWCVKDHDEKAIMRDGRVSWASCLVYEPPG